MLKKFTTKPKLSEVKKVNRTIISLFFFFPYKKGDTLNKTLTKRLLLNCNKNISNTSLFKKKIRELYIMDYSIHSYVVGNVSAYNVKLIIPKLDLIDEFDIDKVFSFLHDSIFNPLIDDEGFDKEHFEWEKQYLIDKEKDYPNSIYEYAEDTFIDFCDEKHEGPLHYDEYMKLLKRSDAKSAYEFYRRNILNNNYAPYIFGNLDYKDEILKAYNKYFKQEIKNFEIDMNEYTFLSENKYKAKNITTKYNQSVLNLFYQIKNIKESDSLYLEVLYFFLYAKENDLLYNKIREKNNLIYNMNVSFDDRYGYLGIRVYFNIEDEKIILKLINEAFDDIKIKKNFETYKKNLLRAMKYDVLLKQDDLFYKVNEKRFKEVNCYIAFEEKIKLIRKITFEDFNKFLNKIYLARKMTMIAGDKHE